MILNRNWNKWRGKPYGYLGGKVWWWLRWGRPIVAVSSGPFPDLFPETLHSNVRTIGTPGVHFKVNHRPHTYFLSAALGSATCERLCWFKKEGVQAFPYCVGVGMFLPDFKTSFSFFHLEISYLTKWIGIHSYTYPSQWLGNNWLQTQIFAKHLLCIRHCVKHLGDILANYIRSFSFRSL